MEQNSDSNLTTSNVKIPMIGGIFDSRCEQLEMTINDKVIKLRSAVPVDLQSTKIPAPDDAIEVEIQEDIAEGTEEDIFNDVIFNLENVLTEFNAEFSLPKAEILENKNFEAVISIGYLLITVLKNEIEVCIKSQCKDSLLLMSSAIVLITEVAVQFNYDIRIMDVF
jgi:hypothetical protein